MNNEKAQLAFALAEEIAKEIANVEASLQDLVTLIDVLAQVRQPRPLEFIVPPHIYCDRCGCTLFHTKNICPKSEDWYE